MLLSSFMFGSKGSTFVCVLLTSSQDVDSVLIVNALILCSRVLGEGPAPRTRVGVIGHVFGSWPSRLRFGGAALLVWVYCGLMAAVGRRLSKPLSVVGGTAGLRVAAWPARCWGRWVEVRQSLSRVMRGPLPVWA